MFAEMKESGIVLDGVSYQTVYAALGRTGQWQEAVKMHRQLVDGGTIPTTSVMNALIAACARNGEWESALDLFDEMQELGIGVDVVTCNTLISACERARRWEQALLVYDAMRESGIVMDTTTFNTLLSACAKGGQPKRVEEFYEDMKAAGVPRDEVTFNVVISSCEQVATNPFKTWFCTLPSQHANPPAASCALEHIAVEAASSDVDIRVWSSGGALRVLRLPRLARGGAAEPLENTGRA
eukprot:3586907-Pyramimonas_sp.AAC.1